MRKVNHGSRTANLESCLIVSQCGFFGCGERSKPNSSPFLRRVLYLGCKLSPWTSPYASKASPIFTSLFIFLHLFDLSKRKVDLKLRRFSRNWGTRAVK
ncbi:hypothetical protein HanXRQr2_Chr03g0137301 [Helianthus annuus]|uniref:Uncharacterized protein n=1 Tax=Helianthus annuus TaxID=4232 RepID=A0A9K3JKC9_HELAN|nr:hypothetical protein HanXRQr2_Chr03g0137301 [Helianthus annuus]KAJ0945961.1 hypothetical protein HanPSC8_Chr03g0133901 [Helianthus annuus]